MTIASPSFNLMAKSKLWRRSVPLFCSKSAATLRPVMPPIVPRKRLRRSPVPGAHEVKNKTQRKAAPASSKRKATLFDDLDAATTPLPSSTHSASLAPGFDLDDSDSSLTSLSDADFEGGPPAKRQKGHESAETDDDDDDVEFEDVAAPSSPVADAPAVSGDLELTLIKDNRVSLANSGGDKRGPSKRARKIRNATHCLHVMLLLWHNALRNSWLCDPELQAILISHLPLGLWMEVERWKRSSGLSKEPSPEPEEPPSRNRGPGSRRKADNSNDAPRGPRRDWGTSAKKLEEGAVDMSHGDPLFRLMQSLASWWKQRYRVTVPGLRKSGYMELERLDRLTKAYAADPGDCTRFGELIPDLPALRECAQTCRGSRDVGAQLFTSLLRGLGLEARMVANLPCLGFGWNKMEDADPEKSTKSSDEQQLKKATPSEKTPPKSTPSKKTPARKAASAGRLTGRKSGTEEDSDELRLEYADTDDESVVEAQFTPQKAKPQDSKLDTDLEYPHYWTEVLSPVTKKYLSVDPIVKHIVATNRDLVESFEPRGAKADKARQVMAYIIGHSQDGTAKDVTVRYLKKRLLPGRTKGTRMPLEKVPVYDRNGKVKRHEKFDWFKSVMSGYRRGGTKAHTGKAQTEIDDQEDATDLKPAKAEAKEVKEGEETLQYYKQSKDFVLERHLKREEALKPGAAPVKVFRCKAKGGKEEEEDVYLRSDVVNVKSFETWHKQGRAPMPGEQPLKRVPYRAATTKRRRELLEAEAALGEKVLQGLFSREQTDWIIPPPIENGVIPKNEYGNIDLFDPEHMCPKGAVHVPYRGSVKVCKRLQIDFAEAVVGFEFGHRMAVPVIHGVVVAVEHHDQVMAELEKDDAERERKEDEKRRKAALGRWRKFVMGLHIVERIRQDYGEVNDGTIALGNGQSNIDGNAMPTAQSDEDMAGGFLPEGYVEEGEDNDDGEEPMHRRSSFFPVGGDDEDDENENGNGDGGLIMEDERRAITGATSKEAAIESPTEASGEEEPPGTERSPRRSRRKAAVATSTRARTRRATRGEE